MRLLMLGLDAAGKTSTSLCKSSGLPRELTDYRPFVADSNSVQAKAQSICDDNTYW